MQNYFPIDWMKRHRGLVGSALLLVVVLIVYLSFFTPEQRTVRRHLAEADQKSVEAIDRWMSPVHDVFKKGRDNSNRFAREALSWSGKFALLQGMLRL